MNFDEEVIEFPCGDCGRTIKVTIGWLKLNSEYECDCGTINEIDATDVLADFEDMDNILKKISK
jgi:hypothetical protein